MNIKVSTRKDGNMSPLTPEGRENIFKFAEARNGDIVDVRHTKEDFIIRTGKTAVVPFADCHPVFVYHEPTQRVIGIHTGWKAVLDGVIHNAVKWIKFPKDVKPGEIKAWIGPGLMPKSFEVGDDVADQFPSEYIFNIEGKQCLDIASFILARLKEEGITNCVVACEDTLNSEYFSYRTDKKKPVDLNIAVFDWK